MEEVVAPRLGICHSKEMTSRLVQTVQLSWSLQSWNLMREQLSLSCPCPVCFFLTEKHWFQRSQEILASPGMCNMLATTEHGITLQKIVCPCISNVRLQVCGTVLDLYFGIA